MSKRRAVKSEHYLFVGVVLAVAVSLGAYFNVPLTVFGGPNDRTAPVISNIQLGNVRHDPNTAPGYYYYATITWNTDEAATSWVCTSVKKLSAPRKYTSCWGVDQPYVTTHSIDIRVEAATTVYYVIHSADASSNLRYSAVLSYTAPAQPATDITPPTVSLTAPADTATVSGTIVVAANASDNIGVTQVQFLRNGSLFGTDTVSPYSINWGTLGTPNGTYLLTAVAKDAAGNSTTSLPITVFVNNISTTTATTTP